MGDNLIALTGAGFVVMAADTAQTRSVLMLAGNVEKMINIDSHKLLGLSGPQADRMHFSEYVKRNLALYNMRTGETLRTDAAASWTRNELATALRRGPYQVNLLLAGYDAASKEESSGEQAAAAEAEEKKGTVALYTMDYLASCHRIDFACQGYANYFLLGLLDKHYEKDMSLDKALDVLNLCIRELKTRFVLNTISFAVKVVDKDGVRDLETIV